MVKELSLKDFLPVKDEKVIAKFSPGKFVDHRGIEWLFEWVHPRSLRDGKCKSMRIAISVNVLLTLMIFLFSLPEEYVLKC